MATRRRRQEVSSSSAPPLPVASIQLDKDGWVRGSRFLKAAYLRELVANEELMGTSGDTRLVTLSILTRYGLEKIVTTNSSVTLVEYKERMIREEYNASDAKVFLTLNVQAILRPLDLSTTAAEDLPSVAEYVHSTLGSGALSFIISLLLRYHGSIADEEVKERITIFATSALDLLEREGSKGWRRMP